jgi:hypothetical protein
MGDGSRTPSGVVGAHGGDTPHGVHERADARIGAADGGGLVSSAITRPTAGVPVALALGVGGDADRNEGRDDGLVAGAFDGIEDALAVAVRDQLRFPRADLVGVAASMWPTEVRRAGRTAWHAQGRPDADGFVTSAEFGTLHEGAYPRVEIGPGMLRFGRVDHNRAERARAAAADRHARQGQQEYTVTEDGSIERLAPLTKRGVIRNWAAKSRSRMIATVSSLDTAAMLDRGMPGMLTLTLPGDWLAVAPSAAAAAACFDRFTRAYAKKWKVSLACIWKREFQRRGAPHWHLWMVPPTGDLAAFRRWVRFAWATAMQLPKVHDDGTVPGDRHDPLGSADGTRPPCSDGEWCRSINAGTNLDFAEALRAADPRRLAVYFLKESGVAGEAKAYQNDAPAEWSSQHCDMTTREVVTEYESVGRFWGVRGIPKATVTVDVDPEDQYAVWRVMRHLRESTAGVREQRVPRVNMRTGQVRYRKVRRRVKVTAAAGWIAVNDGANVGSQLGSWVAGRHAERVAERRAQDLEREKSTALMPDAASSFWEGVNA